MKAVFDVKPSSNYDDEIAERYQFPKRYQSIAEKCVGDWVVFRRPRDGGGNLAYFAIARLKSVDTDSTSQGLSYAILDEYLAFDRDVPWSNGGRYAERALREIPKKEVGVYLRGRSIRPLEDADFTSIVCIGLPSIPAVTAEQSDPSTDPDQRQVEKALSNRTIRDASFRRIVRHAYQDTCAITRLKILDQNGNCEAQAAHIRPVSDGGPDVVSNGILLSSIVHWLFDRHLISISEDYRVLLQEDSIPNPIKKMMALEDQRIWLPQDPRLHPSKKHLRHRHETFIRINSK